MNRLENRLLDAFRTAAETITPDSVPSLSERPRHRSWQRLVAPLAAAAAVIVIAAVIAPLILSRHAGKVMTRPSASPSASISQSAPLPTPTLYVVRAGLVIPVNTATNAQGPPIHTGCAADALTLAPNGKTAYVLCETSVVPVNTATNTAGRPINIPGGTGSMVISPDGRTAYFLFANQGATSTVTPLDLATGSFGKPIELGRTSAIEPIDMAMTPDGKTIYVIGGQQAITTQGVVGGYGNVTVVSTVTHRVEKKMKIGNEPMLIAITPDGRTAYVASSGANIVTPINTATNTAENPIDLPGSPLDIAITPDGKTAYVVVGMGVVVPINTATNRARAPIQVGRSPQQIAITPDGKTAYVSDDFPEVTPINIATNKRGNPIPLASSGNANSLPLPQAIIITPDGKTVYVANAAQGTVTPITIANNTPQRAMTIGTGLYEFQFAVTP